MPLGTINTHNPSVFLGTTISSLDQFCQVRLWRNKSNTSTSNPNSTQRVVGKSANSEDHNCADSGKMPISEEARERREQEKRELLLLVSPDCHSPLLPPTTSSDPLDGSVAELVEEREDNEEHGAVFLDESSYREGGSGKNERFVLVKERSKTDAVVEEALQEAIESYDDTAKSLDAPPPRSSPSATESFQPEPRAEFLDEGGECDEDEGFVLIQERSTSNADVKEENDHQSASESDDEIVKSLDAYMPSSSSSATRSFQPDHKSKSSSCAESSSFLPKFDDDDDSLGLIEGTDAPLKATPVSSSTKSSDSEIKETRDEDHDLTKSWLVVREDVPHPDSPPPLQSPLFESTSPLERSPMSRIRVSLQNLSTPIKEKLDAANYSYQLPPLLGKGLASDKYGGQSKAMLLEGLDTRLPSDVDGTLTPTRQMWKSREFAKLLPRIPRRLKRKHRRRSKPPTSQTQEKEEKFFFPMIPADHPVKIAWDIFTVLLTLISARETHASIRDRTAGHYNPLIIFIEAWFVVDVLLNFVTEHKTSTGEVVRDGRTVWARYLTSWFVVDVLGLIPWERVYIKPIVDMQKRRNFFAKNFFFRPKAVVRVTRKLRGNHFRLFGRVASRTKHAGVGGQRLLRLIVRYLPKYIMFYRNMRGVLAVRFLRQIHFIRRVAKGLWFKVRIEGDRFRQRHGGGGSSVFRSGSVESFGSTISTRRFLREDGHDGKKFGSGFTSSFTEYDEEEDESVYVLDDDESQDEDPILALRNALLLHAEMKRMSSSSSAAPARPQPSRFDTDDFDF